MSQEGTCKLLLFKFQKQEFEMDSDSNKELSLVTSLNASLHLWIPEPAIVGMVLRSRIK